jgi:hypothetical protein
MDISVSADHWTIDVRHSLSNKMEAEMIGNRMGEQRKEGRERYKVWRKEMRSRIPKRNGQTIYFKSIAEATEAFKSAGLKESEYEIRGGFFMGF